MRRLLPILVPAVLALLMLGGCGNRRNPVAAIKPVPARLAPSDRHDDSGWQAYFKYVIAHEVDPRHDVVIFYLPAPDTARYDEIYRARIQQVHDAVSRGPRRFTVLAFETSDPARTADFIVDAVRDLPPDSMKETAVFFVSDGDSVDRVWRALARVSGNMIAPAADVIAQQAKEWASRHD
jgi:hypothetical protein